MQQYTHTHICKLRVCMWRWETKPVPVSSGSPFSISIPVFWCNPAFLLIQRDTCRSLVIFWPGRHRETLLLSKAKMKVYVHPFLLCDATWVWLDSESWARAALPRQETDGALEKWVFPCLKLRSALGLMLAGIQRASRVDKSAMVINNCRSRMFSYTFDPVLLFNPSPEHSSFILFSALWISFTVCALMSGGRHTLLLMFLTLYLLQSCFSTSFLHFFTPHPPHKGTALKKLLWKL